MDRARTGATPGLDRGGGMRRRGASGQALTEFAIVVPFALLLIFGIIALGLWIFYQQQVTNVAREAARWAAIHSSTAICPTTSWRDPQAPPASYPLIHCDGPENAWPFMVAHARQSVWGVRPSAVSVNACWSGYVPPGTAVADPPDYSAAAGFPLADFPADIGGVSQQFVQCRIAGVDPVADAGALPCGNGLTTAADDPASDIPGNYVTAYVCMPWSPPLAGFLLIPSSVTLKAVVTEVIHRQQ